MKHEDLVATKRALQSILEVCSKIVAEGWDRYALEFCSLSNSTKDYIEKDLGHPLNFAELLKLWPYMEYREFRNPILNLLDWAVNKMPFYRFLVLNDIYDFKVYPAKDKYRVYGSKNAAIVEAIAKQLLAEIDAILLRAS